MNLGRIADIVIYIVIFLILINIIHHLEKRIKKRPAKMVFHTINNNETINEINDIIPSNAIYSEMVLK